MRDFLDFLMPRQGLVEIRAIKDGRVHQWWESDRQAAVDRALAESASGSDSYYGVLPRLARGGTARDCAPSTGVLWADLDAKAIGSKHDALMALTRYKLSPSVVVDSGHGYHAYWKLDSLVDWEDAKRAMIGIAKDLVGDHVYDQPRILRIPGTTNWKHQNAPVPVRTVVFNTTQVMSFRDFSRQSVRGISPPRISPTSDWDKDPTLPGWLDDLIRDGMPQGERSEACWKVMKKLIVKQWSDEDIRAAFDGGKIGEKMREMRNGDKWFKNSLAKARATL